MNETIYVGLDVHKDSITICFYNKDDNDILFIGKIDAKTKSIIKSLERCRKKLKNSSVEFIIGYEASCFGFSLAKELNDKGYSCIVMAPNSIYDILKNRKIKNDERDAQTIARALAYGQYNLVHIPDEKDLDAREIIHLRNFIKNDQKRVKNNINSLIIRNGYKYNKNYWTQLHLKWLKTIELNRFTRISLNALIVQLEQLTEQLTYLDTVIEEISQQPEYKTKIKNLRCIYGIDTLSATTIISEIGDFTRFPTAKNFVAYLGLLPGEKSSGPRSHNTDITKAGNKLVRTILVEVAQNFVRNKPEFKSKYMRDKQKGADQKIINYADRCNRRLFNKVKMQKDRARDNNKIKIAIAHDLACFIWGMMTGRID